MFVRKTVAAVALGLVVITAGGQLASAAPVDDKRAQAAKLKAQIDANGSKISAIAEKYNGARVRLDQTSKALADAQNNLGAAEANARKIRGALSGRAAELLKAHAIGATVGSDDINLSDVETAAKRAKYAQISNGQDREALNRLAYIGEDLATKRKALSELQAQRKRETDAIAKAEADIKKANADQQKMLAGVNAELKTLIAQEEARQRSAAQSPSGGTRRGAGNFRPGLSMPNITSPNGTARAAIAFAQAQLGKPYVYAAAGPDSFDCSGLTMSAYRAAGVGMGHYSGSQFGSFPHVNFDELLPGDLVFWGPGGSNHVGLYIGGGLMIHAPQTGDVVKVAPLHGSPSGAVRPWL
jgi:cell wall-associated NlpC family hydrolase